MALPYMVLYGTINSIYFLQRGATAMTTVFGAITGLLMWTCSPDYMY